MNHKRIADKIRKLADSFAKHYNFEEIAKAHTLRAIADELDPPPDYKVGDWVECEGRQYRIVKLGGRTWNGDEVVSLEDQTTRLTMAGTDELRKLDPSEVKVKVTLEGTVYKHPHTNNCFLLRAANTEKYIAFADIDPHTAKTIRELIKAQEEE